MKLKLSKSSDQQYYFVITAGNGQTILASETYHQKASALKTIAALNKQFSTPLKVVDLT